ncbi:hypothetical protein I4U23_000124 [Adineta vaga]|nr:hypothetical protein I4U23_000124 [Adineta vaga]
MTKVNQVLTEQILDPITLPQTNNLPVISSAPVRVLPKYLADFKQYVDSKFCYYAAPLVDAEMVNVQQKVAYQCHMKILVEERNIVWKSYTRRLVESTVREGQGMANRWDYEFALPLSDGTSRQKQNLPEGNYLTRCSHCRGKCVVTCTNSVCNGRGTVEYKKGILSDRSFHT